MPSLDHQLLKGSLDILLLGLLERGPLYGYQIVKDVRTRSESVLDLKEGTLSVWCPGRGYAPRCRRRTAGSPHAPRMWISAHRCSARGG
jgi:hypothetical protein